MSTHSEPIGVRYAVAMRQVGDDRVWWPRGPMDPSRRIGSQAHPKLGKLYQKRGDAEREKRHWESKARSEMPRGARPQWTFQIAMLDIVWPELFASVRVPPQGEERG